MLKFTSLHIQNYDPGKLCFIDTARIKRNMCKITQPLGMGKRKTHWNFQNCNLLQLLISEIKTLITYPLAVSKLIQTDSDVFIQLERELLGGYQNVVFMWRHNLVLELILLVTSDLKNDYFMKFRKASDLTHFCVIKILIWVRDRSKTFLLLSETHKAVDHLNHSVTWYSHSRK
jgi:hypothetical protein